MILVDYPLASIALTIQVLQLATAKKIMTLNEKIEIKLFAEMYN